MVDACGEADVDFLGGGFAVVFELAKVGFCVVILGGTGCGDEGEGEDEKGGDYVAEVGVVGHGYVVKRFICN